MITPAAETAACGLILQEDGTRQESLSRVLTLMLNYQYGLDAVIATDIDQALDILHRQEQPVRAVFAVDSRPPSPDRSAGLTCQGDLPLFWLCPQDALPACREALENTPESAAYAWQELFAQLVPHVGETFARRGIDRLWGGAGSRPKAADLRRIQRLLQNIDTLPTLPHVILKIMRLVNDPQSTAADLERVLINDPAVVHKLLRVISSPLFAGHGQTGRWTLKEAIVRLGRRKVGAVAQQIKLINSFVAPPQSGFKMKRFWLHSIACAAVADRLYEGELLPRQTLIEFDDYWIAALLHDIGKLFLGSFFSGYFADLQRLAVKEEEPGFYAAEARLGHIADHAHVSRLMLIKSKLPQNLIEAVGKHHDAGPSPKPLTCLIHLADNLCKDLGLGYLPEARGQYDPAVLLALGLGEKDLDLLRAALGPSLEADIGDLLTSCS